MEGFNFYGLIKVDYGVAVMKVLRPDFMGLGLVSVSSLKGLGLVIQRSRSRSRLLYRDHKTWKGEKWK